MYVVELPNDFLDRIPSWVNTLLMLINSMVLSFLVYAMIDYCVSKRENHRSYSRSRPQISMCGIRFGKINRRWRTSYTIDRV